MDDGGNIYPHSYRPAEAYLYGKYYMYHWQGHGSTTQLEFELFHWHGDPEMRAFTAIPVAPGVTVDSPWDVLDVDVLVNITHTYTGDLELLLISPAGSQVVLSNRHGSGGNNFTGTLFDDDAVTPIASGSAPFTGSFQPEQPLTVLVGKPSAGAWIFKVVDHAGVDIGTIDDWQLRLTVNEPCDSGAIFIDGFEGGDTLAWSSTLP